MSNTGKTPPSASEVGPLVGRDVGGFQVTGYIGEGPTGVAYRCEDMLGNTQVMKVLHRELSTADAIARFSDDLARLVAHPDPQLLRPIDSGTTDEGQYFVVCDELAGEDLAETL